MQKLLISILLVFHFWGLSLVLCSQIQALENQAEVANVSEGQFDTPFGVHLMHPEEIEQIDRVLINDNDEIWGMVTVPITFDSMDHDRWSKFFIKANEKKVIPVVRLATRFEEGSWVRPTKADVIKTAEFLNSVDWMTTPRRVVIYNEPNHAAEWGGAVDPESYAEILDFSADWFHTDNNRYLVLPAGLDAAAPDGTVTMESFNFMKKMAESRPQVFGKIDAWTSHSYPNPAFSSSAYLKTKNGISGWRHELEYLKENFGVDLSVYITETGWDRTKIPYWKLVDYYTHTFDQVWSDERVVGVTAFVLNGNNGLFEGFSWLEPDGSPTPQWKALMAGRENFESKL